VNAMMSISPRQLTDLLGQGLSSPLFPVVWNKTRQHDDVQSLERNPFRKLTLDSRN
jgi:hypothetical protein